MFFFITDEVVKVALSSVSEANLNSLKGLVMKDDVFLGKNIDLMNDHNKQIQLLIDEEVLQEEELGCHPCVCTCSLKLKIKDLVEKFLPAVDHDYQVVHLPQEE